MKHMNTDILAKLALLVVAIVWGSSLVVVKSSTDRHVAADFSSCPSLYHWLSDIGADFS